MTNEQASKVVGVMTAGFPRESLEPATVAVFAREIALLQDAQIATEAAFRAVRDGDRFPTVKEFRELYRATANRHREATTKLGERRETDVPEWVQVWWWLRHIKDDWRTMPQQPHVEGTGMTHIEYEPLAQEWRESGSPRVGSDELLRMMSGQPA